MVVKKIGSNTVSHSRWRRNAVRELDLADRAAPLYTVFSGCGNTWTNRPAVGSRASVAIQYRW
jgi:hypothetical protein